MTALPWGDGAGWRATVSGSGAVASVSACVQGVTVPAPRGVLTTTRLDWPFDTARVDGRCIVRKPDGSVVGIVAISGRLSGALVADSLALHGRVTLVERVITAATASPDSVRRTAAPELLRPSVSPAVRSRSAMRAVHRSSA